MNKSILVIGIILLFIGMNITSSSSTIVDKKSIKPISDGNTLYVGGIGEGNYTKIQSAIDTASEGDTIFVFDDSAPYSENLLVNKSINLIGENNESTIIDGNRNSDVVRIISDKVYIKGFTIRNGGLVFPDAGISIKSSYNMIIGNNLIDNYYGVGLFYSHNNEVINNHVIDNNQCGIYLENSSNNNVSGNYIDGQPYNGVGLWNSSNNNMISRNTIVNNAYSGIRMLWTAGNIITLNTISDNLAGVRVEYSPNVMILKNNFMKNRRLEAFFVGSVFFNNNYTFMNNYWNRPRFLPKIIFGLLGKSLPIIPWINLDWQPAKEPYDI